MPSQQFESFVTQLGMRKDVAAALWDADIHSPQELAAMEPAQLQKITNTPLLISSIHPILQKYVFNISMAKDPYKKALAMVRKHAAMEDSDDDDDDDAQQHPVISSSGTGSTPPHLKASSISLSFIGGNHSQSAFLSTNTNFYNTDTCVSATSKQSIDGRREKEYLQKNPPAECAANLSVDQLDWKDGSNYKVGDVNIPRADVETRTRRMNNEEMYAVTNHGSRRALVINTVIFSDERMTRHGADRDTTNITEILQNLGFMIQCERNKTAVEIKDAVKEFAQSQSNENADMVAIYIGSHGERDEQGNDSFLGTDGQCVNLNDIKQMFSPQSSHLLRNKPKLFFLQFCRQAARGTDRQYSPAPINFEYVQSDTGGFNEETRQERRIMDMVCTFATGAGNKAYRNTQDGSWFVTALIRILTDHAHNDDLLSMLTKVNNCVSSREGRSMEDDSDDGIVVQISEVVHNLRKKVFFYPASGDGV